MPLAWVFNLEADEERARGPGWLPSRALYAKLDHEVARLREALVREGDVVIDRERPAALGPSYTGAVWSVTPRSIALLRRAKVTVGPFPSEAIVTAVSSRAFAQRLPETSPREVMVTRDDRGTIELPSAPCRVSLAHTAAGRGHVLCETDAARDAAIEAAIERTGAAFVAERVEVVADFSIHGWIDRERTLTLGGPTESIVDRRTLAWRETVADASLDAHERSALEAEGLRAGEALASAWYFGPFGLDAFRYRTKGGAVELCARCELNARFTMGWPIGMRRHIAALLHAERGAT